MTHREARWPDQARSRRGAGSRRQAHQHADGSSLASVSRRHPLKASGSRHATPQPFLRIPFHSTSHRCETRVSRTYELQLDAYGCSTPSPWRAGGWPEPSGVVSVHATSGVDRFAFLRIGVDPGRSLPGHSAERRAIPSLRSPGPTGAIPPRCRRHGPIAWEHATANDR